MSVRIEVKDTGSFRRPSLYKFFASVSVDRTALEKQHHGFCSGEKASRDAVVVVVLA